MAGKELVLQSLPLTMRRASRSKRTASGALAREAVSEGAAGHFAAPGVAPRHSVICSAMHEAAVLVATGLMAMLVGLLVYLTDRDPAHAALIPAVAALAGASLFGALGQWMPSFLHPFAFSLFTAAVLPPRSAWRYRACAAWCAVNLAFECGQHPLASARLAEWVQGFGNTLAGRMVANYFLLGTFDGGDIVAALLGGLAAVALLWCLPDTAEKVHAL